MTHIPEDGAAGHPLRADSTNAEPPPSGVERALAALYLEVPEMVARDMNETRLVRAAVAAAHAAGVAEGREAAARIVETRFPIPTVRSDQGILRDYVARAIREDR